MKLAKHKVHYCEKKDLDIPCKKIPFFKLNILDIIIHTFIVFLAELSKTGKNICMFKIPINAIKRYEFY